VVYAADEQGTGQLDILLRAVGGQNVINLTKDSPADDSHPAFSPDGERIAFRSGREGGGGLYVMGRTGESVRRVSDQGYNPAWSPDGNTLAYVLEPAFQPYGRSTESKLWTVHISTGARTQLPVEDAMQPAWSPHGQRIVYWGLLGDSVQRDLWTVAPAGGDPVRLTNDAAVDWSPVWSPDGRHIYYASDGSGQQNVWRIGVDEATGQPRGVPEPITLPRQSLGHLSFAADGTTLAAASNGTTSNLELLAFDLKNATVSGRRRVTNVSENTSAPSLSPDGKAILFYRLTNGQEDLWLVARDGTGLRQLTNDPAHDRNPQFLPDGRRLLFYSDRGGRYQIWTMGLDGGDARQVTDVPSLAIQARIARDGTRAFANLPLASKNILFDPRLSASDQKIEELPTYPDGGLFRATAWSPDGTRIAGDILGGGGIAIYDVTTRRFTSVTKTGVGPVWLPDGRRILYRAADPRTLDILDVESGASRRAVELPREVIGTLDISNDGREIVAVIINRQADVVLAKLAPQ
jgi:Tol biopolymer transport system component